MRSWTDSVIWWQVYPLGFVGAEKQALPPDSPVQHRLPQLLDWLDYLVELGCNGLALNPVFASESHGYDIVDHFAIDPRLGDDADIDAADRGLPRARHPGAVRRGLQPRRPGVPGFRRRAGQRPGSAWADWFHIDWDDTTRHDGFGYRTFEGHGGLVALNHDSPAVADYVVSVMEHWLDRGIDGWRLDAAYAVPLRLLAPGDRRVRETLPGRLVRRRGHPRRLPGLGAAGRAGLRHPVRALEVDLELAERRQLLRAGLDARSAPRRSARLRPADVRRQPRRHPDRQPSSPTPGTCRTPWWCCSPCPGYRASTTATSRASAASRRTGRAATMPIRPAFPADPPSLAQDGWPIYRLHQNADRSATAGGLADFGTARDHHPGQRAAVVPSIRVRRAVADGAAQHR